MPLLPPLVARPLTLSGLLLTLAIPGFTQSRRLNGPLPRSVLGDVVEQRVSPDGAWVVFRADRDRDEVFELFSVRADGAAPEIKLNGPLSAGGDVSDFVIGPDSAFVVYRADQDADESAELYGVPIGGGNAVKLGSALVAGGDVQPDYAIDPAGTHLVYRTNHVVEPLEPEEFQKLFSVPLDGGSEPVDLFDELAADGTIRAFRFGADGTSVLFVAEQRDQGNHLLREAIDGSGAPLVLVSHGSGTIQGDFVSTPDGSRIVYRLAASGPSGSSVNLWSVRADGSGGRVQLSRVPGGRRGARPFFLAPDATRVVYIADQDAFGRNELYSAPVDGSSDPLELSGVLGASSAVEAGFGFSPDGALFVYRLDTLSAGGWAYDLCSVPVAGGASPTFLSGAPSTYGGPFYVQVGALGRVVYSNLEAPRELRSVPVDGSSASIVLDSLASCYDFQLTADGGRVVYTNGDCVNYPGSSRLYGVPVDGRAAPTALDGAAGEIRTGGFVLSQDGSRVAYRKDQLDAGVVELFLAPTDGAAPAQRLNGPFPTNALTGAVSAFDATSARAAYAVNERLLGVNLPGDPLEIELAPGLALHPAQAPQLTPGGDRVLFAVSGPTGVSLYAVAIDATSAPVELGTGHGPASYLQGFRAAPDGSQVAYLLTRGGTTELFRVPVDGSAAPTPLSGALVPGGAVQPDFQFTPDGARVVYRADQEVDERFELFSADGVAPPVKLNPPLTDPADIALFQLTSDGRRAVFPGFAPYYQLMSAPLDGSAAALTIAFPPTQYVRFQVSPVASEVVYQTYTGIYRTPDDAASPSTLVTFDVAADRNDVLDLQLTTDGRRVVYVADQNGNEDYELFSVPVDASAPSVELSHVLAANGDVTRLCITPDGARVVFIADQGVNERFDLFSVPVDTRAGLVKLDPLLPPPADVADFQISPDGAFVAYRADPDSDGVLELFAAPVTARRAAVRMHRSISAGSVAHDYAFTPDSRQLLFRIDRRAPGAHDLHASWVPGRGRPTTSPPVPR